MQRMPAYDLFTLSCLERTTTVEMCDLFIHLKKKNILLLSISAASQHKGTILYLDVWWFV